MKRKLEICCYTIESAIIAEQAGADRIELCDNYSEGGTTPSFGVIEYAVRELTLPVNVIVRPRGGDFLYSQNDFEVIKSDVHKIGELRANGIVIGFLKNDGNIDLIRTKEIVKLAGRMDVTFHRAFDMCKNPIEAVNQLIDLGVKRILTSGAKPTAYKGMTLLKQLVEIAEDKIIVMPGGGVTENNIQEMMLNTCAVEFHSSAKIFDKSEMLYRNKDISMSGISANDEFKNIIVDRQKVRMMADIIRHH